MSIESKHAYRFGFLKSEEWQLIRIEILSKENAECSCCGKIDWSNDIHHVRYPKRWKETKRSHVAVLCRGCHNRIHELFGNRMPTDNGWVFRLAIRKVYNAYGSQFSANNLIEELGILKSPKVDERRRFTYALTSARRKIRNWMLTASDTGSKSRM